MKAFELLEWRRNQDQNPKSPIEDIILDILASTNDEIIPNVKNNFTSFTQIEKLGLNPSSSYNTPIGIYAYPTQYVAQHSSVRDVEFAGDSPFINTFKVKGNILDISNMSKDEFENYREKIIKLIQKITKKDVFYSRFKIRDIVFAGRVAANVKSHGGIFWYLTWDLAYRFLPDYTKAKSAVIWNWLFRQLDIDGVVDQSDGIIHENEPTQAVFFSKEIIYDVKRFNNIEKRRHRNEYSKQLDILNSIHNVDELIDKLNGLFNGNYIPYTLAINKYLIPAIKQDPSVVFDLYRPNDYITKLYFKYGGNKQDLIAHKYRYDPSIDHVIKRLENDIKSTKDQLKKMSSTDPQYQELKRRLVKLNKELNLLS